MNCPPVLRGQTLFRQSWLHWFELDKPARYPCLRETLGNQPRPSPEELRGAVDRLSRPARVPFPGMAAMRAHALRPDVPYEPCHDDDEMLALCMRDRRVRLGDEPVIPQPDDVTRGGIAGAAFGVGLAVLWALVVLLIMLADRSA